MYEELKKVAAELREQYKQTVYVSVEVSAHYWESAILLAPGPRVTQHEKKTFRIHVLDRGSVSDEPSLEEALKAIHRLCGPVGLLQQAEAKEVEANKLREAAAYLRGLATGEPTPIVSEPIPSPAEAQPAETLEPNA
jgi:hypothetical protein